MRRRYSKTQSVETHFSFFVPSRTMRRSTLAFLLMIGCRAQAQSSGTDNHQKLPMIKDHESLVEFSRLNPETIVAPFNAGLAVFDGDTPIAVTSTDLAIQFLPEIQRFESDILTPNTTAATSIADKRNVLENRACSRPGCCRTALCYQYNNCHVCFKTGPLMNKRDYCL